jgi:signal transduction histidine kinase
VHAAGRPVPEPLRRRQLRPGLLGLRFRIYLLVSVGVLVPAALIIAVSWSRLRDLDEEMVSARRAAAVAVAEHIDEELTADLGTLQRLASLPQLLRDGERVDRARELLRGAHLHSQLRGLFLLDEQGRALAEEPQGGRSVAPPPGLPELQQTLQDGKPRVTGMVGSGEEARTYALVPAMDWRGRPVGVVGGIVDFSLPARTRDLRNLLLGGSGYADLVDASGRVLASTDRTRLQQTVVCRERFGRLIAERRSDGGISRDCDRDGSQSLMAFAPLAAARWGVSVMQPQAVLATAGSLPASFAFLGLALLLLAGAFAWGAARSVTRPIAVLTGAAERIASGGLDEPIPELGEDELGRLGRSLERMRSSLQDLLSQVGSANELLERRVEERTAELAQANDQLRERDAQRQRLLRTVITAQEDERRRIARELHDETTQSLAVLVMGLETATVALRSGGPQPRLDEVKALAVRTLEEVHRLIFDLRPAVLDDLGLFSALRLYAERVLASRGIAVRCEIQELDGRLPPEFEIALFRIGQEVMNNIARHARAESVLIQLGPQGSARLELATPADAGHAGAASAPRELRIEIEDDGQGFDPGSAPGDRPHYGLLGIRERAELLGGVAIIDSAPGRGTRVEVRIPLPPLTPPEGEPSPVPAARPSKEVQ